MHGGDVPLLDEDSPNTLELFQIWLNLPPESKMVDPYFGMLWNEAIPTVTPAKGVSVNVIAGRLDGATAPAAPPDSWASKSSSHLAIWLIQLDPGAVWDLPAADGGVNRMLNVFDGDELLIDGSSVSSGVGARLDPETTPRLEARDGPVQILLLQGRPIGAPVFQMGPFVMNSAEELRQAVEDYRRTQFGGWPWSRPDPVHHRSEGRFAIHADGTLEHRDRQPV